MTLGERGKCPPTRVLKERSKKQWLVLLCFSYQPKRVGKSHEQVSSKFLASSSLQSTPRPTGRETKRHSELRHAGLEARHSSVMRAALWDAPSVEPEKRWTLLLMFPSKVERALILNWPSTNTHSIWKDRGSDDLYNFQFPHLFGLSEFEIPRQLAVYCLAACMSSKATIAARLGACASRSTNQSGPFPNPGPV